LLNTPLIARKGEASPTIIQDVVSRPRAVEAGDSKAAPEPALPAAAGTSPAVSPRSTPATDDISLSAFQDQIAVLQAAHRDEIDRLRAAESELVATLRASIRRLELDIARQQERHQEELERVDSRHAGEVRQLREQVKRLSGPWWRRLSGS
jgi:hypothetical protein